MEEIDKINIYHAGLLAMQRAVQGLSSQPDFILVDARKIPNCHVPQRGIIRGDALSASIAAASILAKTTRRAHARNGSALRWLRSRFAQRLSDTGALPGVEIARCAADSSPQFARVREALGLDPIKRNCLLLKNKPPHLMNHFKVHVLAN